MKFPLVVVILVLVTTAVLGNNFQDLHDHDDSDDHDFSWVDQIPTLPPETPEQEPSENYDSMTDHEMGTSSSPKQARSTVTSPISIQTTPTPFTRMKVTTAKSHPVTRKGLPSTSKLVSTIKDVRTSPRRIATQTTPVKVTTAKGTPVTRKDFGTTPRKLVTQTTLIPVRTTPTPFTTSKIYTIKDIPVSRKILSTTQKRVATTQFPTHTTPVPPVTATPQTPRPTSIHTLPPATVIPSTTIAPPPKPSPLEWYNRMFDFPTHGFDVRYQTLHSIPAHDPKQWKHQIFSYAPHHNGSIDFDIWRDEATGKNYQLPSFVREIRNSANLSITKYALFDKFDSLVPLLFPNDNSVQISGNFSHNFKETLEKIYAESVAIISELQLKLDWKALSTDFLSRISQLKSKPFITNQKLYEDFFRDFGTHFIAEVEFGGILRLRSKTDTAYFGRLNEFDRFNKMQRCLERLMDHALGESSEDAPADFLNHTTIQRAVIGGGSALSDGRDVNSIDEWQNSIKFDRVPVRVRLEPLHRIRNLRYFVDVAQLELALTTTLFRHELAQWSEAMAIVKADANSVQLKNEYSPTQLSHWLDKLYLKKKPYPARDQVFARNIWVLMKHDVDFILAKSR